MSKKQTLLVIGNGMVGQYFLASLVKSPVKAQFDIVTFCEEPRAAYDRVHLSDFFTGTSAEQLSLVEDSFFEQNDITIYLGDKAISIDREQKIVTSELGVCVHYDKLVLATGSYPFVPTITGHDRTQCLVYRTIEDLEAIALAAKTAKIGTVVGGGLLGLEAAKALRDLGLITHVVEFAPRLMAMQLDDAGGAMLRRKIEALGVIVHTDKNTRLISDGEQCANKMCFTDGEELETDLIVFSTGIRPRDYIARACGLEIANRGGIVIDNDCKTSDPDIYAIGECASWNDITYGLVAPGYAMARTVVANLAGNFYSTFRGADMSTKLKLMGVDVASIGDAHGETEGAIIYSYQNGANEVYKRLVVSDDQKYLLGAVLVGDASSYSTLLQYYLNCFELPENPDVLILPRYSGEAVSLGVDSLLASAAVCSCYNVTKGDICKAIAEGYNTVDALKKQTQAAIGCGVCTELLELVLESELAKQSAVV
jgi:nitrite reductase (NADH) large subunit